MKKFLLVLTGLIAGYSSGTIVYAQAIKILPDANLCICYDQPAATLVDANAMKLEVFFDKTLSNITAHTCSVNAVSPTLFSCNFSLPTTYQTVGMHTVSFKLGNLEADDTISWGVVNTITYEVTAKRGAPGTPVNIKIIKRTNG